MRVVYVTDLHGWQAGYEQLVQHAIDWQADAVINGGDMAPPGDDLVSVQRRFYEDCLPEWLAPLEAEGINYYAMFGNEDIALHWPLWKKLVDRSPRIFDLTERWHALDDDYWLRGCGHVPDFPYRIKDWALRDLADVPRPDQREAPIRSGSDGVESIADLEQYFADRPTLADQLSTTLANAPQRGKLIAAIHAPPVETGLGVLPREGDVGSFAVRQWIEAHQPCLTLHGHIHESPDVTGLDTCRLGRTTCHQPGQRGPRALTLSHITLDAEQVSIDRQVLAPIR
jgi:Icc-related predicted phosphoesterase